MVGRPRESGKYFKQVEMGNNRLKSYNSQRQTELGTSDFISKTYITHGAGRFFLAEKDTCFYQKINEKGAGIFNVNEVDEKSFTTDFLTDKTIEIMEIYHREWFLNISNHL